MATSFPLDPEINDLYQGYYWDGNFWKKSGQDTGFGYLEEIALQTTYLSQSSASTNYATKTYADNAVLSVIDTAPSTLNTLNELAAALNNDENFSSTVITSIGNKLDISSASTTYATKSSPTFTGISTFNDIVVNGSLNASEIVETVSDVSISSGSVSLNFDTSNIFYITNSPSANFTVNLTNAPTTDGRTFTVTSIVTQGSTGYIPSSLFINGSSQTIKWTSGVSPVPTSSSGKIDIFNFTVIRRSSSWIVIGTYSTNF
jgi:hypothetical protein